MARRRHPPILTGASLFISATTIYSNSAAKDGAGLFSAGDAWVENSTVSENLAVDSGGGVEVEGGGTALVHTSVISNRIGAEADRVGIYKSGGSIILTGTLVANNRRGGDNKVRNCGGVDPAD
ncbi:MAG: hypothetical protein HC802_18005, partial [Caldilineaceae bacterium]|nr:hypothetical protein [Caldilineaceae bacterium]